MNLASKEVFFACLVLQALTSWSLRGYRGTGWLLAVFIPFMVVNWVASEAFRSSIILHAHALFYAGWLASYKLALLALNRGPLVTKEALGHFPSFAIILLLPILPKSAGSEQSVTSKPRDRLILTLIKGAIFAAVVYFLHRPPPLPPTPGHVAKNALEVLGVYSLLGIVYDAAGFVVPLSLGWEIAEPFRAPFVSTSFKSFWRRWNLIAGATLRNLCYDTLVDGHVIIPREPDGAAHIKSGKAARSHKGPSGVNLLLRRILGLHLAFFASGAMHEAIFYRLTGVSTYKWFFFFFLQAPIIVVERVLVQAIQAGYAALRGGRARAGRATRSRAASSAAAARSRGSGSAGGAVQGPPKKGSGSEDFPVPYLVQMVVALGLQFYLGVELFFSPVMETGLDARVVRESVALLARMGLGGEAASVA